MDNFELESNLLDDSFSGVGAPIFINRPIGRTRPVGKRFVPVQPRIVSMPQPAITSVVPVVPVVIDNSGDNTIPVPETVVDNDAIDTTTTDTVQDTQDSQEQQGGDDVGQSDDGGDGNFSGADASTSKEVATTTETIKTKSPDAEVKKSDDGVKTTFTMKPMVAYTIIGVAALVAIVIAVKVSK